MVPIFKVPMLSSVLKSIQRQSGGGIKGLTFHFNLFDFKTLWIFILRPIKSAASFSSPGNIKKLIMFITYINNIIERKLECTFYRWWKQGEEAVAPLNC